ncbi:hypothetical protein JCGZ_23828 [Jatropha curcas]|uniref:IBH1-like N-terminal domain-containing protein n=1 Tax=Jatropha curcas TaxID=180498 RepID=A0A067L347_JATCU|nr:transcription factor IBH1 [Jatropha curcas]KDP42886.1 hypothetical protein JCGZ_23828 [Jatropha curcas]
MSSKSNTKTRFARGFLISLSKIRTGNRIGPVSDGEIRRRSRRIKIAAYSSMARAVGSRRAWSRAFLLKVRNRARFRGILKNRKMGLKKKKRVTKSNNKVTREISKTDMLRKLVPGGAAMDICGLLEETAHYMECLQTQVEVMQNIVDHCSKR